LREGRDDCSGIYNLLTSHEAGTRRDGADTPVRSVRADAAPDPAAPRLALDSVRCPATVASPPPHLGLLYSAYEPSFRAGKTCTCRKHIPGLTDGAQRRLRLAVHSRPIRPILRPAGAPAFVRRADLRWLLSPSRSCLRPHRSAFFHPTPACRSFHSLPRPQSSAPAVPLISSNTRPSPVFITLETPVLAATTGHHVQTSSPQPNKQAQPPIPLCHRCQSPRSSQTFFATCPRGSTSESASLCSTPACNRHARPRPPWLPLESLGSSLVFSYPIPDNSTHR
jgi:hypothetical protein